MSYSIVIPSRITANLRACLAALDYHEPMHPRVIVVDDGLDASFRAAQNDIAFVDGIKPFVFARNVNLGIAAAERDDVIILGDDALLETPNGFSSLASIAARHPTYGIISSTTNGVGNRNQLPKPGGANLRDEPRMVCFVCVYITRPALDVVGLLDERFIHYGHDDDDWCLRARLAGFKLGIFDGCYVDHRKVRSTFRGDGTHKTSLEGNRKIFVEKWGDLR